MKTLFKNEYIERARKLAEDMYTDLEMCAVFGINEATFYRWQKRHGAFRKAVLEGKEKPNREVEASLKRLCLPHQLRKVVAVPAPTKDDPQHTRVVRVDLIEVDPNERAVRFFLKNRRPDKYNERIRVDLRQGEPLKEWEDDRAAERLIAAMVNGTDGGDGQHGGGDDDPEAAD